MQAETISTAGAKSPSVEISEYALPGLLGEMARIVGVDVAIAVARRFGGRRLYIPQKMKRDNLLAKAVGMKAASIIARHYSGDTFEIPSARHSLRHYDARKHRAKGKSSAAIAEALGIGERQVRALLQGFEVGEISEQETEEHFAHCPVCGHRQKAKAVRSPDSRQLVLPLSE